MVLLLSVPLVFLFAGVAFLIEERSAYAYIDPGTGSLVYQTALSLLLGVGLVLRQSRHAIARLVRRLRGIPAAPDNDHN